MSLYSKSRDAAIVLNFAATVVVVAVAVAAVKAALVLAPLVLLCVVVVKAFQHRVATVAARYDAPSADSAPPVSSADSAIAQLQAHLDESRLAQSRLPGATFHS